jgi:hypothetical protein
VQERSPVHVVRIIHPSRERLANRSLRSQIMALEPLHRLQAAHIVPANDGRGVDYEVFRLTVAKAGENSPYHEQSGWRFPNGWRKCGVVFVKSGKCARAAVEVSMLLNLACSSSRARIGGGVWKRPARR